MPRVSTVPALLAVVAACGREPSASPRRPDDGDQPGQLRVVTYNVNFGVSGDPAGVEAVARAKPDLVLFQETTDGWERALVRGLGDRLPHHHFDPTDTRFAAGGMGVMARWPIVSVEKLPPPPGGLFFAHRVVVDAPGGNVQLLNLHLRPPMSDEGSWVVGFFSTRADREREARAYLPRLDPALPTIVAGDFNEQEDGLAFAAFQGAGFTSALAQHQPDAITWQWPLADGLTLKLRLDHVLHDRHFRAIAARTVEAGRSDHLPVWADLERLP